MRQAIKTVWECVRTVSGDNAYELYLERHAKIHGDVPPLSRRAFYAEYTNQKWSGVNRCC
ncbi:MAG TPA: YbdD/YjiX family protein [Steroidobacteraceae bacterium]|nr:YbdD/YjiX family protein [Steroidobacteraceae bacterium]